MVVRTLLSAAVRKSSIPSSSFVKFQYVNVCTALLEHVACTARRTPAQGAAPSTSSDDKNSQAALPTHSAATAARTSLVQAGAGARAPQKPVGSP
jgi:hypothetical protein